jgi:RimJ/RimL family protein N-acetyltransferase
MSDPRRSAAGPDFLTKPVLTGDLVTLRCVTASDLPTLRGLWEDAEIRRLTGSHPGEPADEARLHAWYATRVGQGDRLDLAVVDNATGAVVGEAALNGWDADNESCSFRIALLPGHHGRGLGTEATRLICGHGFEKLGLHRISLEVFTFNPRARRSYEKAGFVAEGTLREALSWQGAWVDATLMSILAGEWARHGGRPECGRRE